MATPTVVFYWLLVICVNGSTMAVIAFYYPFGVNGAATARATTGISMSVVMARSTCFRLLWRECEHSRYKSAYWSDFF